VYEELIHAIYSSHSSEHSKYTLKVDNVYEVKKTLADFKFKPFEKAENRTLLYHGTRIGNLVSILKGGLKIAPLEA
jgi:hypothetical protein